jgi:uncharacterized membrane protein
MPATLHWFKWEAFFTWLSGISLLAVVYYLTGGAYLLDSNVSNISESAACALGVGLLIVSWIAYDLLWKSPIGRNHSGFSSALCFAALIGITYGLCHTLSGRAAFIHVGAMLGSIMVLNVWMRILPAQQKMIDATKEGRTPDYSLGMAAKRRSIHNTYMTFPVLFIMLSNHYSMTYAGKYNWITLLLLIFAGASVRHAMVSKVKSGRWALVPAAAALVAVIALTAPHSASETVSDAGPVVTFTQARAVIAARCLECHSTRIRFRAVETKTMPLLNKTGITDEERGILRAWIDQGAKIAE